MYVQLRGKRKIQPSSKEQQLRYLATPVPDAKEGDPASKETPVIQQSTDLLTNEQDATLANARRAVPPLFVDPPVDVMGQFQSKIESIFTTQATRLTDLLIQKAVEVAEGMEASRVESIVVSPVDNHTTIPIVETRKEPQLVSPPPVLSAACVDASFWERMGKELRGASAVSSLEFQNVDGRDQRVVKKRNVWNANPTVF